MNKREFLTTLALAAGTLPTQAMTPVRHSEPAVLTLTGAIDRSNRGPVDQVLEQLMHKQGVKGERVWSMSLADLAALPQTEIHPTVEYDGKIHTLSGPLLADVLKAAGIAAQKPKTILLHGIDGYSPEVDLQQALRFGYVLAIKMDGKPLSIGGLGPIFAVCDADRIPELARLPLDQRFANCPWGLYCIELS